MQSLSARAAPLNAVQQSRYDMRSPLLFGMLAALAPEVRYEVLDLTPAHAGLLDYFSRYHCKLYLPGCRDTLCHDAAADQIPRLLKRLLPMDAMGAVQLDLLLIWDLPNYLPRDILTGLITYLSPYMAQDAQMHCYIHTRQHMPAQPGNFMLCAQDRVQVDLSGAWDTASPMYHQSLLNKLLAPFRVERGVLLANGLQEYVFRRQSPR